MLAIDHIYKSYGTRAVLRDLTFDVPAGEIFGFVGGNGAGKTTAMRIMLGVTRADSGSVRFAGRPMDNSTRARVGYMPEERGLYPKMPIARQLAFFAELHGFTKSNARAAASYWLARLDLEARAASPLEDLSLGNQQRVQLATALVHRPSVLILDEPFSGLDPIAVDVMSAILREEADRGVPVLFSSHQLDLVEKLCDRIGIMADGSFLASGTVSQLSSLPERQVLVRATVPADQWLQGLPTSDGRSWCERLPDVNGAARLALHGVTAREVLDAVQRYGDVQEFRPWTPSLTDLYRAAVTPGAAHSAPAVANDVAAELSDAR